MNGLLNLLQLAYTASTRLNELNDTGDNGTIQLAADLRDACRCPFRFATYGRTVRCEMDLHEGLLHTHGKWMYDEQSRRLALNGPLSEDMR